jgi:hypothetical protein
MALLAIQPVGKVQNVEHVVVLVAAAYVAAHVAAWPYEAEGECCMAAVRAAAATVHDGAYLQKSSEKQQQQVECCMFQCAGFSAYL